MTSPENIASPTLPGATVVTTDTVATISSITNPVHRNLQITACYHDLSAAFSFRTGIVSNWCTFATWASKQAGVTIRGEDLQRKLEEVLSNEPEIQDILGVLKQHSRKFVSGALQQGIVFAAIQKLATSAKQRASESVARGNKKVFEEIGLEFARFIGTCLKDRSYDEASITNFCTQLRHGPPPNGQDRLSIAFRSYYKAFFEPDTKVQGELILLANIQIGFHEQTRLQPEIAESLDAANIDPQQVRKHVTDMIVKNKDVGGKLIYFFTWLIGGTNLFKKAIDSLVFSAEKHIRKVITKTLMTLTLPPDSCLHLGDDLTAPYPAGLATITNPELQALLKQLRPRPDAIDGAGCSDWADLMQRIHFIANLFRCYHESKDLFTAPFTPEQLDVIRTGKLPGGRL